MKPPVQKKAEGEKIILKKGDVYHFQWSKEEYENEGYGGALRHCFEGLLVVMDVPKWNEDKDKYEYSLGLVDTFWGVNRLDSNRSFTLEEAEKRGSLIFYCNLNDIEKIKSYELDEYEDEDLVVLHDQHSCSEGCRYFYKKKGAIRSPGKKINALEELIQKHKRSVEYALADIERISAEIERLKIKGFE